MPSPQSELTISISTIGERVLQALEVIRSGPRGVFYVILHQQACTVSRHVKQQLEGFLILNKDLVTYHEVSEVGVASSRNAGIELCETKYMLFADDDVRFTDHVFVALDHCKRNNCDIGTFICLNENLTPRKKYPERSVEHTSLSILAIGTVEILINVEVVRSLSCKFPTNMGAGRFLSAGDEPIFLARCLTKDCKIAFFPTAIVIHAQDSSGNLIKTHGSLASRGIVFKEVFGLANGFFLLAVFALKSRGKFSKYGGLRGVLHSIYFMYYGFFKLEAQ